MKRIGPHSRPDALCKLDGRTKEARLLKSITRELVTHVGGRPTAVQSALINQLSQLRLRLALMDAAFAGSGEQTEHDSRTYLAWANTFSRGLHRLGVKAAQAEKPRTLADYLAASRRGDHAKTDAELVMQP